MRGEPARGDVAAAVRQIGGPVEQDVRELQRLPDARCEPHALLERAVLLQPAGDRVEGGEHLAHTAGHDVAVVGELAVVVEVGFGRGAARGPDRVAAHALRHHSHRPADRGGLSGRERREQAQPRRKRGEHAQVRPGPGHSGRLSTQTRERSGVAVEGAKEPVESLLDLPGRPWPGILECVAGAAQEISQSHRVAHRLPEHTDVDRERAGDEWQESSSRIEVRQRRIGTARRIQNHPFQCHGRLTILPPHPRAPTSLAGQAGPTATPGAAPP